jgi:DNA-binding response OmpR family regulator
MRLLCIDDNEQLQKNNKYILEYHKFDVDTAFTLAEAKNLLAVAIFDAIILDIMLPDGSGLDFLRELRENGNNTPVIMLTAIGDDDHMVEGFTYGADDYISKPFSYEVLTARINALFRRKNLDMAEVRFGPLRLDVVAAKCYVGSDYLNLTAKEFAILMLLIINRSSPTPPEYIFDHVWGGTLTDDRSTLWVHISRLKNKLFGIGEIIKTKNGYLLKLNEE